MRDRFLYFLKSFQKPVSTCIIRLALSVLLLAEANVMNSILLAWLAAKKTLTLRSLAPWLLLGVEEQACWGAVAAGLVIVIQALAAWWDKRLADKLAKKVELEAKRVREAAALQDMRKLQGLAEIKTHVLQVKSVINGPTRLLLAQLAVISRRLADLTRLPADFQAADVARECLKKHDETDRPPGDKGEWPKIGSPGTS
jgi:hypothetical protein